MSLLDHFKQSKNGVAEVRDATTPPVPEGFAAVLAPEVETPTARPDPAATPPETYVATSTRRGLREREDALDALKVRVHEELIRDLEPEALLGDSGYSSPVRRAVEQAAEERLMAADSSLGRQERLRLASDIADEILGLGPIEPLLRDPKITEVMVNAADKVYFERDGTIYPADVRFRDDTHVMQTLDKILRPVNRRLDDGSPMVDARLRDGSRVNAVIPPLAVKGPSITIRKFSRDMLGPEDLIRLGSITPQAMALLAACVRARLNILISGGTGTGKTTLLNILSSYIPARDRIVTIENPAELQLKQDDWVSLETRPPNIEGKGRIDQRELVVNALRMRPDRIIVGECRAGEAFDMLQAMNTGHDGSLTTVHANSPRDALARIENMVLMAVELPIQAIREQISSGINMVVHINRMQDGTRKVTNISEIVGMQGSVVSMHDIFEFQGRGVDAQGNVLGRIQATGLRPHFIDRLEQFGQHLPVETFLPQLASVANSPSSSPQAGGTAGE